MRENARVWCGKLNLKIVKVALVLLGSALFLASSPGGCGTAYDPSGSPLGRGQMGSSAHLAHGATRLTWTQDGEHILFSSGGLLGVYIVDSAGLELRAFPETAPQFGNFERPGAFAPTLSPDGSRVAYNVFVPRDSTVIETAALDGTDVRRLTPLETYRDENGNTRVPNRQHNNYPVWSPDGQQLTFVSNRAVPNESYGYRIFAMNADGTNVRSLAPSVRLRSETELQWIQWSSDSSWIAFIGFETDGEGKPVFPLYTVQPDGSKLTRLGSGIAEWSPDGRRLAFRLMQSDTEQETPISLITARPDGSEPISILKLDWGGQVAWSPDGSWLAVKDGARVYIASADGAEVRPVADARGPLVWTSDGGELWYGEYWSGQGDPGLAFAVRPDGSGLRELIPGGIPNVVETAWSPDGLLLAVLSVSEDLQFKLYSISRDGLQNRVLVRGTADRLVAEHSDWRDVSADIAACAEFYSGSPGLVRDCQTLLRIRDTLAGEALLNWKASVPMEQWQGIGVGGSPPRVRLLSFGWYERNILTGVIPPEIGSLSELESIQLIEQRLTGEIPREIGNLTRLRTLHLYGSGLGGHIPLEIGNLAELTELEVGSNGLSGNIPPSLGNLTKLEKLYLDKNRLSGSIPPELGNLKHLQRLSISNNNLAGTIPPELGGLTSLVVLHLQYNQLDGTIPPELGKLENLVNLYLQGNYLRGCVPATLSDHLTAIETDGLDYCD